METTSTGSGSFRGAPAGRPPSTTVDGISRTADGSCRTRHGTFPECPLCGSTLAPEHAHFKCVSCGWRDSCCD